MFDSLKYAKILEDSGLPREQAETHIRILNDVMEGELATKKDLDGLGAQLRSEMKIMGAQLRSEMQHMEHRIVYKLGALMVTVTTLGVAAAQMISG